ncbi:MAG: hypothetical protein JW895_06330 [Thermoleophilaceae bacterium]|nr:hypothetical protein [Thermoleophilaceae bacterium]
MSEIETLGEESVLVAGHGADVAVAVTHDWFGRIATVRLDPAQALLLAEELERAVLRSEEIA